MCLNASSKPSVSSTSSVPSRSGCMPFFDWWQWDQALTSFRWLTSVDYVCWQGSELWNVSKRNVFLDTFSKKKKRKRLCILWASWSVLRLYVYPKWGWWLPTSILQSGLGLVAECKGMDSEAGGAAFFFSGVCRLVTSMALNIPLASPNVNFILYKMKGFIFKDFFGYIIECNILCGSSVNEEPVPCISIQIKFLT